MLCYFDERKQIGYSAATIFRSNKYNFTHNFNPRRCPKGMQFSCDRLRKVIKFISKLLLIKDCSKIKICCTAFMTGGPGVYGACFYWAVYLHRGCLIPSKDLLLDTPWKDLTTLQKEIKNRGRRGDAFPALSDAVKCNVTRQLSSPVRDHYYQVFVLQR